MSWPFSAGVLFRPGYETKRAGLTDDLYHHSNWFYANLCRSAAVDEEHTTLMVERFLDERADGATTVQRGQ